MAKYLYIVATPIGNLEDITLRALRILKEADVLLCEDTRVTKKLLSHFDIHTRTESYHANSPLSKIDMVARMLEEGQTVALVSDAGTPMISDPGSLLVATLRSRFEDLAVIAVPGPSSLTAALSVSGLPASEFLFLGFLPHKKGREMLFKEIAASKRTVVFFESTHRLMKTLGTLAELLPPDRTVVVATELTKVFENVTSGTVRDLIQFYEADPKRQRGEFVIMVAGA
jgi:16S rRNA (cytidine1402-2'-O)-methyltransferase